MAFNGTMTSASASHSQSLQHQQWQARQYQQQVTAAITLEVQQQQQLQQLLTQQQLQVQPKHQQFEIQHYLQAQERVHQQAQHQSTVQQQQQEQRQISPQLPQLQQRQSNAVTRSAQQSGQGAQQPLASPGQTASLQIPAQASTSHTPPLGSNSGSSNPSPKGSVPRLVCSCNTVVLFPASVLSRTCWQCGAVLSLGSSAPSKPSDKAADSVPPRGALAPTTTRRDSCGGLGARQRAGSDGFRCTPPPRLRSASQTPSESSSASSSTGTARVNRVSSMDRPDLRPEIEELMKSLHGSERMKATLSGQEAGRDAGGQTSHSPSRRGSKRSPERSAQPQRPRDLPSESVSPHPSASTSTSAVKTRRCGGCHWLIALVLVASLVLNARLIGLERSLLWNHGVEWSGMEWNRGWSAAKPQAEVKTEPKKVRSAKPDGGTGDDSDGDGIPDHDDFCSSKGSNFRSGKATDFDGDGCQDGVEDSDRDNDGIRDAEDKCPNTPMDWDFHSSAISDVDGDGCADSLEDPDNDGDGVPNVEDECPRTRALHKPDGSGCSPGQKAPGAIAEEDHKWWQAGFARWRKERERAKKERASASGEEEDDSWSGFISGWWSEFRGAWAEIIVGALLTTALTRLNRAATSWQQQLPEPPTGSFPRVVSAPW